MSEPTPLTAAQKAALKEKAEGPQPYVTIFAFELRGLLGEIDGYRQALARYEAIDNLRKNGVLGI